MENVIGYKNKMNDVSKEKKTPNKNEKRKKDGKI